MLLKTEVPMSHGAKSEIKTIVFDIGHVLIDWNPRYVYREYFDGDAQAMEHFLTEICAPEWNRSLDAGKSFDQGVTERQALYPEHAELIAMWRDRWADMLGDASQGTVDILSALRDKGYPVYAITNWSAETFPVARERFPFLGWFLDIVVSGEVGAAKPDARIFEIFLEKHGVDPRATVFIDDSAANVAAANTIGFKGVRYVDPPELRRDLEGLGVRLI